MNLKNEKQKRNNKGITLIALVITIIVLLILAGVSIAMLAGDNGLLNKASSSKIRTEQATVTEQIALAYQDYQIELKTSETTKLASTSIKIAEATQRKASTQTFLKFLEGKQYIDNKGIVKVENLVGHKMLLGNGEGKSDVYIVSLDEDTNKYILTYYDEKSNGEPLWSADSNRKAVKINISKTPETEMATIVKLQVTSVEGIVGINASDNEDAMAQLLPKISTMSPEEKKEIWESMFILMLNEQAGVNFNTYEEYLEYAKQRIIKEYNESTGTSYITFEEFLNDINEKNGTSLTEEEFLINSGLISNDINDEDICYAIINLFKDESTGEIKTYEIINPEGAIKYSYIATENGTYEFTVKDIFTGETYKKSVEVTNIVENSQYYVGQVGESDGQIGLIDKVTGMPATFEGAYVIERGERIDISAIIEKNEESELNYISGESVMHLLAGKFNQSWTNWNKGNDLEFILVKDGILYMGAANLGSYPE